MYLRFILARLIWEFDITIEDKSKGWEEQSSAVLFNPGPLYVSIDKRQ